MTNEPVNNAAENNAPVNNESVGSGSVKNERACLRAAAFGACKI